MGPKIENPPFIDTNLDLLKKNTYKQTKKWIPKNNMNIRQVLMWTATSLSNLSMGLVIIEVFFTVSIFDNELCFYDRVQSIGHVCIFYGLTYFIKTIYIVQLPKEDNHLYQNHGKVVTHFLPAVYWFAIS